MNELQILITTHPKVASLIALGGMSVGITLLVCGITTMVGIVLYTKP